MPQYLKSLVEQRRTFLVFAVLVGGMLWLFVLDLQAPYGVIESFGYPVLLTLCLWLPYRSLLVASASVFTGLTIVAGVAPHGSLGFLSGPLFNRLLVVASIWAISLLLWQRISLEAELRKRRDEAVAASQAKSSFLAVMSHELRTPLTSIAGALGLLEGGAAGRLPERAGQLVDIARKNIERLVRLLNDILDLEKIESGKMTFKLAPVGLGGVVAASIEANRAYAHKLGAELWLAPAAADGLVFADPDRLGQVLTNLLSNAAKFSPRGGRVEVGIAKRGEVMRVSVRDYGPGVPAEFRKSIFQKFAQADSSDARQLGGTGLGLNIAKRIAEHHGGELSFEAAAGGGTTFHLDLPALRDSIGAGGRGTSPQAHVLHVEDDEDVLHIVAAALDSVAQVTGVRSVRAARAALARDQFDVMILDLALPDGSGLDLLPHPGAGGGAALPVIIFSVEDADAEAAARAYAVLTKSKASVDELVRRIKALIAERANAEMEVAI